MIFIRKIIFLLSFCLILCSCKASYGSALEVMDRLYTPCGTVYKNDTDMGEEGYISPEELGYLYYGESKALVELDRIESYCIYTSRQKRVSEIHILEAVYQSDVETLCRMLRSRADFLSELRINPNQSDYFCDMGIEYKIFSKGRFVFLIVGDIEQRVLHIDRLF